MWYVLHRLLSPHSYLPTHPLTNIDDEFCFAILGSPLGSMMKAHKAPSVQCLNHHLVHRSNFFLKSTAFDAESDALRDELGDMNVEIIDDVGHTVWMIKDN